MDVDRPEETSTIVRGLNASTRYLFRVRASVQGLGDWSNTVEEATLGNGERMGPAGCVGPWGCTLHVPLHLTSNLGAISETILVASPNPEL